MPQAPDEEHKLADLSTAKFVSTLARQSADFLPIRIGMTLAEAQNVLITATLEWAEGNIKLTASMLGIDRSTLYQRIRRDNLRQRIEEARNRHRWT